MPISGLNGFSATISTSTGLEQYAVARISKFQLDSMSCCDPWELPPSLLLKSLGTEFATLGLFVFTLDSLGCVTRPSNLLPSPESTPGDSYTINWALDMVLYHSYRDICLYATMNHISQSVNLLIVDKVRSMKTSAALIGFACRTEPSEPDSHTKNTISYLGLMIQ